MRGQPSRGPTNSPKVGSGRPAINALAHSSGSVMAAVSSKPWLNMPATP